MKQALALTFLSSITCLVAWDAEAAPHARPEARPHAANTELRPADKNKKKKVAKTDKDKKKKVVKASPVTAKAPVPLSGSAKADASFTLGAGAKEPKTSPESAARPKPTAELHDVKEPPKRSYWLAADPHVPLAIVDGTEIRSVGRQDKDCGPDSRWARPKSRWNAVDAWGQITGSVMVGRSQVDDATGCHELSFRGKENAEPHVLLVSEDSAFKPSEKLTWAPREDEYKRFENLTAALEKLWVNKKPFGKTIPLQKRAIFFQSPKPQAASDKRPTRWAVVGGPILLVAYLGDNDHWRVASVKNPLGSARSYRPVGVFDMNGDKVPEIIYHSNEGSTYGDNVLSLDADTLSWEDSAVSPGGTTP